MESERDVSISTLLNLVKDGNENALEEIWRIYHPQLISLVEHNLKVPVPIADADDIAQSTMKSFYFRVREGRFPDLEDRDSLWKLLVTIALNKTRATSRNEFHRKKLREENLDVPSAEFDDLLLEFRSLIEILEDEDPLLKKVALARFEGYTYTEIAQQLDKSVSSVERKVNLIKDIFRNCLAER